MFVVPIYRALPVAAEILRACAGDVGAAGAQATSEDATVPVGVAVLLAAAEFLEFVSESSSVPGFIPASGGPDGARCGHALRIARSLACEEGVRAPPADAGADGVVAKAAVPADGGTPAPVGSVERLAEVGPAVLLAIAGFLEFTVERGHPGDPWTECALQIARVVVDEPAARAVLATAGSLGLGVSPGVAGTAWTRHVSRIARAFVRQYEMGF